MLHSAVQSGDVQRVRLLIKRGANCNARDNQNRTPLHCVVLFKDYPDIVEELINGGAEVDALILNDNLCDDYTPLHMAVVMGFTQSAEVLIARGASVKALDQSCGWNTLHWAIADNNSRMVQILISHGINIEVESQLGETPLHFAIRIKCTTDIVQFLLDNGADVNKKSRMTGNNALHVACELECNEVADLLVKFGADINERNRDGKTALQLLPNVQLGEDTARVIIREAVKREALGQPLCEGYKQIIQSYKNYAKFDHECREEFNRMRSERIHADSTVSFFQIFSKNEEKLAALVRDEKIVVALETSNYLKSFKIYGVDLTIKLKRAKRRANFLIGIEDFLVDVLGDVLPAPILQKIAAYVEYDDIIEDQL